MRPTSKQFYGRLPTLEENQGAVTEEDAAFLFGLAILLRPTCIAEVGTGWNRSLRAFCEAKSWLKESLNWECEVWSCDTEEWAVRLAKEACPTARIVQGNSDALMREITPSPQLIFLDGSHDPQDVMHDYETLQIVSADNTVFVFHDTNCLPTVGDLADRLGALNLGGPRGMALLKP